MALLHKPVSTPSTGVGKQKQTDPKRAMEIR